MASTEFGFMDFLVLMTVLLSMPTGSVMGKPEGEEPSFRPRCRWEGNISIDFK